VPLYTADALVLRTYKLGDADRIVVFLTRDRGKKRGVAPHARRPRSRFMGALEPLTEVRVAYFEKERRELVSLNYAETVRSPMAVASPEGLTHSAYFAELLDACAQDADPDERLFRLGTSVLEALADGTPVDPLARYFECWVLRLQGIYPSHLACDGCGQVLEGATGAFLEPGGQAFACRDCASEGPRGRYLSPGALAFLHAVRRAAPKQAGDIGAPPAVLRELELAHRAMIATHLEKDLKSVRVVNELRRGASPSR
jgi:DNA repair protein RecO (recombination protein O)